MEANPRDDVEGVGDGACVGEEGKLHGLGLFMPISDGAIETDWDFDLSTGLSFLLLSSPFSFFVFIPPSCSFLLLFKEEDLGGGIKSNSMSVSSHCFLFLYLFGDFCFCCFCGSSCFRSLGCSL